MRLLSFAYRFLSNFIFLALVYYSLNSMEKYQQRAVQPATPAYQLEISRIEFIGRLSIGTYA